MNAMYRLLAAATAASALLSGCVHPPLGPDYVAPAPLSLAQAAPS